MINEEHKYTDLLNKYSPLIDEYERLAGCYNAVVEQNKQLQAKLNGGNMIKEVE